jgi:hypothetical protein
MARLAALLGLAAALVAALHWWEPFLTEQRAVITSTPSPGPRSASIDIPLRAGSQLCVAPVDIDTQTAQAQVKVAAAKPGPTPLEVDPGAAMTRPALQRAPTAIRLPVPTPRHDIASGRICVRNASDSRLTFIGTNDPIAIGLARTTIDGKQLDGQAVELALFAAGSESILGRLGEIVHHAADFTGELMPFWLAWPLVVALVIGTPLAIFGAFWWVLRADDALRPGAPD